VEGDELQGKLKRKTKGIENKRMAWGVLCGFVCKDGQCSECEQIAVVWYRYSKRNHLGMQVLSTVLEKVQKW
jgi:hypothetical protein